MSKPTAQNLTLERAEFLVRESIQQGDLARSAGDWRSTESYRKRIDFLRKVIRDKKTKKQPAEDTSVVPQLPGC